MNLLIERGLDVNARESGDNTYAMHWAAAAGELEVIGWATCWDECDDAAHRAVAEFLVRRGARHHIFSAIAMNLADAVRSIVAEDPSALNRRQSRNENHRTPLHFAVLKNRPQMIEDWETAERLVDANPHLLEPVSGALHLMAQRNDWPAVQWLLRRGADVNGRWSSSGAEVTPLHLAAARGHAAMVRALLDAGADPTIHDSMHDSDPLGWAEYFKKPEIAEMLRTRSGRT